jgi:hypothetical protein
MNRAVANVKLGLVRPPIRETLAIGVLHCKRGTFPVIETKPDPVIVAEIELRQVAVQVLLGAVLIDASHTALEDREIAFR